MICTIILKNVADISRLQGKSVILERISTFFHVLTETIIRYLESNKRLVVPQLGTFIVKVPGQSVLFSELLRRDDGVLRGLLQAEGMNELEAAGAVDRFVFEVRHAAQEGRDYPMEGFGVLRGKPQGILVFAYEPRLSADPARMQTDVCGQPAGCEKSASTAAEDAPSDAAAVPASVQDRVPELSADPDGVVRTGSKTASPALKPDPSVKGLRYGKPLKTTNAYTYVGAAPRRRMDKLMVFAIAAAVLALAAIAYGYIRELQAERESVSLEQPLPTLERPAAETSIPTE